MENPKNSDSSNLPANLDIDGRLSILKEIYSMNASAIGSADNKANIIITSISLIIGFYAAFAFGPLFTLINDKKLQLSYQFNLFQIGYFTSLVICISFVVWTLWPRMNIRSKDTWKSPQIFFYHYIASKEPNSSKDQFHEIIDNLFPIRRGINKEVLKGKKNLQNKADSLSKNDLLNEFYDQIWELAQIAERKMWLIRGSTLWFYFTIIFFILSLISFILI